jgi:nucleoside-diphosphate kinase
MSNQTFVFIKPDAISRNLVTTIKSIFQANQIHTIREKTIIVTAQKILTHYQVVLERVKTPGFKEGLLKEFVNQKIILLELRSTDKDTIAKVRKLIGATDPQKADKNSIRGQFGIDTIEKATAEQRMLQNLVHASGNQEEYEQEVNLWFNS